MADKPAARKTVDEPDPFLPGSRSFRVGRGALLVVLLLAYLLVVVTYAISTQNAGVQQRVLPAPNGVSMHFVPTNVDAAAATMTGLMYIVPGENLIDERDRLTVEMSVDVTPVLGAGTVTYKVGQVATPMNVALRVSGAVRDYPFDSYQVSIITSVQTRASEADPWTNTPTVVGAEGDLGGWKLTFADPSSAQIAGIQFTTADGYGIQYLKARRSLSTITLACLILFLMVLLAVMTVYVTRAVAMRVRKVEPSLASWMGAMLFALVPLRNFLPGAPPLGSWIDVLVFFWVEIVIMMALAAYVATWLRDGPDSEHAHD